MKCYSIGIEGFALLIVAFFSLGYAITFITNLFLQIKFALNSTKVGITYYLAKIKLFPIALIVPTIMIVWFLEDVTDTILALLSFYTSVFIPYIFINTLFFHFYKKHKIKNSII